MGIVLYYGDTYIVYTRYGHCVVLWCSAETIYRYIAIMQYLVLQYTAIHLVLSIDILRVNYLSNYCAISYTCVSSGDGLHICN